MHVDVDVELTRHFEHAVYLPFRIGVGIGSGADDLAAALERLHHQLIGAGIVEQPFLREDADLDVDRPLVLVDQRQHPFQAAQADAGIDLELRAHVRRAVEDGFF